MSWIQKFGFINGVDNVNLESLYGGQFTLLTPLIKPNSCILLPHRRSTTVSLETTPFIHVIDSWIVGDTLNISEFWFSMLPDSPSALARRQKMSRPVLSEICPLLYKTVENPDDLFSPRFNINFSVCKRPPLPGPWTHWILRTTILNCGQL